MRTPWYPFATRTVYDQWRTGPFAANEQSSKAVWHTTQGGDGVLNWYRTSGGVPHFTILTTGVVHQHYPCTHWSRALRNLRGGVETNRDGAIQIEIVGHAGKEHTPEQRTAITELAAWLTVEHHVTATFPMGRLSKPYRKASMAEWDNGVGHWGHGHVPENDHDDPDMTDLTWEALVRGVGGNRASTPPAPAAPAGLPPGPLKRGDRGHWVGQWQHLCNALIAAGLVADEDFGGLTEQATVNVERAMGLAIDGVVSVEQFRLAQVTLGQQDRGELERPLPVPGTNQTPPAAPVFSGSDVARGHLSAAIADATRLRSRCSEALEDASELRTRLQAALAALEEQT